MVPLDMRAFIDRRNDACLVDGAPSSFVQSLKVLPDWPQSRIHLLLTNPNPNNMATCQQNAGCVPVVNKW